VAIWAHFYRGTSHWVVFGSYFFQTFYKNHLCCFLVSTNNTLHLTTNWIHHKSSSVIHPYFIYITKKLANAFSFLNERLHNNRPYNLKFERNKKCPNFKIWMCSKGMFSSFQGACKMFWGGKRISLHIILLQ